MDDILKIFNKPLGKLILEAQCGENKNKWSKCKTSLQTTGKNKGKIPNIKYFCIPKPKFYDNFFLPYQKECLNNKKDKFKDKYKKQKKTSENRFKLIFFITLLFLFFISLYYYTKKETKIETNTI